MAGATPILFFAVAIGGIALAGFSATLLVADRRLEMRLSRIGSSARPSGGKLRLPSFLTARGRDRQEIQEKLRLAGFLDQRAMEYFLWIRMSVTIGTVMLVMLLSHIFSTGFLASPWLTLGSAGAAYISSKLTLNMIARNRSRAITAEFPFLLDLILMMLESGVSIDQCFRSIARGEMSAAPRLTQSLTDVVADLDRGLNYDVALDRWAQRIAVDGAKELATLFRQGLFQGVELSPALREFMREFTERRVAGAREAIGRTTVQMILVMLVFFMPALFIVLGGPPVVGILDTLKEGRK